MEEEQLEWTNDFTTVVLGLTPWLAEMPPGPNQPGRNSVLFRASCLMGPRALNPNQNLGPPASLLKAQLQFVYIVLYVSYGTGRRAPPKRHRGSGQRVVSPLVVVVLQT